MVVENKSANWPYIEKKALLMLRVEPRTSRLPVRRLNHMTRMTLEHRMVIFVQYKI
jgi:hypothetical protein